MTEVKTVGLEIFLEPMFMRLKVHAWRGTEPVQMASGPRIGKGPGLRIV